MKHIRKDSSVAHQPAGSGKITYRIDRRYSVARSQRSKLHGATDEKCIGGNQEGIGAFSRKGAKGRVDLADCRSVKDLDFQPNGECRFLRIPYSSCGDRSIARIDEDGNTNSLGCKLMQELQSLGHYLIREKINASRIAARPSKASDKTKLDGVFSNAEDDRDPCCRGFGRKRRCSAGRG